MKDTNIYGVRYQLEEFCLIKFFLTTMKHHSTLILIFFSSTERQSLTEASVTSDPASEAIRSRESVTREDIDAVSVCSITFTRSFVRPLFLWRFQPVLRFDDLFYPKGNFWFGFRERIFGPFSGQIFRSPWTIVVCYVYHTLDHRCVLWIPYLGPSLCAMDTIPLVSTSKTLIHARCLQI